MMAGNSSIDRQFFFIRTPPPAIPDSTTGFQHRDFRKIGIISPRRKKLLPPGSWTRLPIAASEMGGRPRVCNVWPKFRRAWPTSYACFPAFYASFPAFYACFAHVWPSFRHVLPLVSPRFTPRFGAFHPSFWRVWRAFWRVWPQSSLTAAAAGPRIQSRCRHLDGSFSFFVCT